ncbi:MAG: tripartite tricarboxylate transporter TctB family protein [Candidatus Rokubacteria bacterium]|nr:tripartite tricarboxylate transporter TctB family protein [Candidatus Rokubacteria bacterium]
MSVADRITGLAIIVLGVAYWRAASALPKPLLQQAVGPEVFPHLIAGALVVLGTVLAIGPLLRRAAGWPARPTEAELEGPPDVAAILAVLAGLALYTFLYERVGFILSTVLFMAGEIAVLEVDRRRWPWALPVVLLLPVALYLLFVTLLGVTLPAGILG